MVVLILFGIRKSYTLHMTMKTERKEDNYKKKTITIISMHNEN